MKGKWHRYDNRPAVKFKRYTGGIHTHWYETPSSFTNALVDLARDTDVYDLKWWGGKA